MSGSEISSRLPSFSASTGSENVEFDSADASLFEDAWDITISFSCGGWFQMYFFGVAHALVDSGILDQWRAEGKRVRYCGSSAGALAATCLATGQHDFEAIRDFAADAAKHFRSSWRNLLCMRRYLDSSLETFGYGIREVDSNEKMRRRLAKGRLEINVTTLPRLRCKAFTNFTSSEQLVETLVASCCMVPLVGTPFRMRETGDWVVDGGISCFTPHMGEPNCITVSAMYFQNASVHPSVFVPTWWALRPPNDTKYYNLFWMGYNDMIDYLVAQRYISVGDGERLLKPEVDFKVHDSYFDILFTLMMEIGMLTVIRPAVIVCIYVELLFSCCWYMIKVFILFDREALSKLYDNFRNAISLRTLGRLLFGSKVYSNEGRLSRQSRLFRFFEPIALGGKRKTGRECWDPQGSPLGRKPELSQAARRAMKISQNTANWIKGHDN